MLDLSLKVKATWGCRLSAKVTGQTFFCIMLSGTILHLSQIWPDPITFQQRFQSIVPETKQLSFQLCVLNVLSQVLKMLAASNGVIK
jgi:hypothetical protein